MDENWGVDLVALQYAEIFGFLSTSYGQGICPERYAVCSLHEERSGAPIA